MHEMTPESVRSGHSASESHSVSIAAVVSHLISSHPLSLAVRSRILLDIHQVFWVLAWHGENRERERVETPTSDGYRDLIARVDAGCMIRGVLACYTVSPTVRIASLESPVIRWA